MNTIKGGPELRARLDNLVGQVPEAFKEQWANDAAGRMQRTAPRRTGRLAGSFEVREHHTVTSGYNLGAAVYGAFWAIFIDRGTKAHDIEGRRSRTKTLRWSDAAGRTVFARKVHRRRMPRRPFVTEAVQSALRDAPWVSLCQQAWSGRRLTRRGRVSGGRTFLGGA